MTSRVCPGQHVADNAIYIAAVTILATLNISNAVDEYNRPVDPSDAYETGQIRY
jgi:hypothetical protein